MKPHTLAVFLASIICCLQVNGKLKQTFHEDSLQQTERFHDLRKRWVKLGVTVQCGICVTKCFPKIQNITGRGRAKSCLDYMGSGVTKNGYYSIYDSNGNSYKVYCDMTSEPRWAWTLVISWSLKNKNIPQICKKSFNQNSPVNGNSPNWLLYRLSHARMQTIQSQSTHWRSTCSFPTHGIDYTDYVRGSFRNFNIMTFRGSAKCKRVEYINIRGHVGVSLRAMFWQPRGRDELLHIDSSLRGCQFNPTSGAVRDEDNFGWYQTTNPKFRCTASAQSTTQWWFGGYL